MKLVTKALVILLVQLATSVASAASILYSTNDLGTNSRTLTGTDRQEFGVTGLNGVAYAFDKSPVTQIDVQSFSPWQNSSYYLTMQAGNYQVGYGMAHELDHSPYGYFPSFMSFSAGWNTGGPNPVSDLNIQGQVVGIGAIFQGSGPSAFQQMGTFAAFSAVGEKSHGFGSDVNNLNNYIATIPGVSLTSAVMIDDLGRIIADGSDGHAYLLTPEALGPAATVPEPTTALLLVLAITGYGIRSRCRGSRM
jgi:hypothetical protein